MRDATRRTKENPAGRAIRRLLAAGAAVAALAVGGRDAEAYCVPVLQNCYCTFVFPCPVTDLGPNPMAMLTNLMNEYGQQANDLIGEASESVGLQSIAPQGAISASTWNLGAQFVMAGLRGGPGAAAGLIPSVMMLPDVQLPLSSFGKEVLSPLEALSFPDLPPSVNAFAADARMAISDASGAVGGAYSDVSGAVGGVYSDASGAVGNAVGGINSGISGAIGQVSSAAGGVARDAYSAVLSNGLPNLPSLSVGSPAGIAANAWNGTTSQLRDIGLIAASAPGAPATAAAGMDVGVKKAQASALFFRPKELQVDQRELADRRFAEMRSRELVNAYSRSLSKRAALAAYRDREKLLGQRMKATRNDAEEIRFNSEVKMANLSVEQDIQEMLALLVSLESGTYLYTTNERVVVPASVSRAAIEIEDEDSVTNEFSESAGGFVEAAPAPAIPGFPEDSKTTKEPNPKENRPVGAQAQKNPPAPPSTAPSGTSDQAAAADAERRAIAFSSAAERTRQAHNDLSSLKRLSSVRETHLAVVREHEKAKAAAFAIERDVISGLAVSYADPAAAWRILRTDMASLRLSPDDPERHAKSAALAYALDDALSAQTAKTRYGERRSDQGCRPSPSTPCRPRALPSFSSAQGLKAFVAANANEASVPMIPRTTPDPGNGGGAFATLIHHSLEAERRSARAAELRRGRNAASAALWKELALAAPSCLAGPLKPTREALAERPELFDVDPECRHRVWSSGQGTGRPIHESELGGADRALWRIVAAELDYSLRRKGRPEENAMLAAIAKFDAKALEREAVASGKTAAAKEIARSTRVISAILADPDNALTIEAEPRQTPATATKGPVRAP